MGRLPGLARGDLHRRRSGEPARQVLGRREQRVDLVPARRRGVDQGAFGDRGPAERRAGAGGDRLPARVRPDAGRPAEDRRGRQAPDREALSGRGPRRGASCGRRSGGLTGRRAAARSAQRLWRPHHAAPRPAGGLPALRRSHLLAGRQGGDRDRLPQGQRPGGQDLRPDRRLAQRGVRSGRRSRGQDHGWRGLLGRRHQGLRGHQRDAAARGADARDRPADPDLPLADLPVHPACSRHVRRDPLPLDRLRHLGARRDDQRSVELDHVHPRARSGHRLCPPGRGEVPRGAAQDRGPPRGHARSDALGGAGGVRLGRHCDRSAVLPHACQGERHVGPRADRGDRRRLRMPLDAHPAAGALDDLRPARILAVRAPHAGLGRGAADAGERNRRAGAWKARARGRCCR